jgi:pimeloyl-ACP methyl ester carboxylesterase
VPSRRRSSKLAWPVEAASADRTIGREFGHRFAGEADCAAVSKVPETQYAKTTDEVHIAYQELGEGPIDLVFMSTWFSHIDVQWEQPALARFLRRLASFSRLILFDKRGTGSSDPVSLPLRPTLEAWMADILAVMAAAGSARSALWGDSSGGMLAALFAATYPDRTAALVLSHTIARGERAPDYPSGILDRISPEDIEATWGTESGLDVERSAPSVAADRGFRAWWARYQRLSVSPAVAAATRAMFRGVDVRDALPVIRVPTLVLHRRDNRWLPVGHGRYIAEHISEAKYVELDGADQWPFLGDSDSLVDEAEEFLTGSRGGPETDRVLATVLITDIVGSTDRAAHLGDRKWRDLLDAHDQATRRQLERYRVARSRQLVMASRRPSMVRVGRSNAPAPFATRCVRWASTFEQVCTPARSSCVAKT